MKPDLLLECQDELGEGPLWDSEAEDLIWVDAPGRRYHRYDPATRAHETASMNAFTITLAFRKGGGFLVCTDTEVLQVDRFGGKSTPVASATFDAANIRFNDGRVSPAGSLFLGSMHRTETEPLGALYQITPGKEPIVVRDGTITSNGLGWSPDGRTFYYTDSIRKVIYSFDYDSSSDTVSDRRVFVDSSEEEGVPDGLCVDSDGCIWSARWNGWKVTKYDPVGERILDIQMPVAKPTSCAFGGPSLADLFITSARVDLSKAHLAENPRSGDLFVVATDTRGQVENRFLG